MILTPPPYRTGQTIQVQCPVCQETRWIQWYGKYKQAFTGRCQSCAQRQRDYSVTQWSQRMRYEYHRRQKERRVNQRYGVSYPEAVLTCYYLLGLSLRETGKVLEVSSNTVRLSLVRWQMPRRGRGGNMRYYQREVTVDVL